jgi:hypothetical protein
VSTRKFQVGDRVAISKTGLVVSTDPCVRIEEDGEQEVYWSTDDDDNLWEVTTPGHSYGFQDGDVVYHAGLKQFYSYCAYEDYWGCSEKATRWSVHGTVKSGIESGEIVLVVRDGQELFKIKKNVGK